MVKVKWEDKTSGSNHVTLVTSVPYSKGDALSLLKNMASWDYSGKLAIEAQLTDVDAVQLIETMLKKLIAEEVPRNYGTSGAARRYPQKGIRCALCKASSLDIKHAEKSRDDLTFINAISSNI
ncbi:hypothetical protein VNO77_25801 [Canavalia gladiata]|uniref:Uncharacterized protein n=1 Tax=Canavalia gladiata TaxID=3824 RepID=A0AAN9KU30_CANGL